MKLDSDRTLAEAFAEAFTPAENEQTAASNVIPLCEEGMTVLILSRPMNQSLLRCRIAVLQRCFERGLSPLAMHASDRAIVLVFADPGSDYLPVIRGLATDVTSCGLFDATLIPEEIRGFQDTLSIGVLVFESARILVGRGPWRRFYHSQAWHPWIANTHEHVTRLLDRQFTDVRCRILVAAIERALTFLDEGESSLPPEIVRDPLDELGAILTVLSNLERDWAERSNRRTEAVGNPLA